MVLQSHQDNTLKSQSNKTICKICNGEGQIPIGVHYVTHDMAIDAGEPSMEGQVYGYEFVQCETCEGTGVINDTNSTTIS